VRNGSTAGRSTRSLAVTKDAAYNLTMSSQFDDLAKRVRALSRMEKAALIRELIDELDPGIDPEVEKLWIEEAERRYAQYLRGEVEAIPGDEVMAEARKRLR
jgi:putative addiction module component (TIGR02574 family)